MDRVRRCTTLSPTCDSRSRIDGQSPPRIYSNGSFARNANIIPNAFGERAVLKLMFGALIRAAERWRSIKITEFERRQLTAVRKELDQEYETQIALKPKLSKDATSTKISSTLRT